MIIRYLEAIFSPLFRPEVHGDDPVDDVRLTKLDARAALTTPPTQNPLGALIGERFAVPLANVAPFKAPTNLDFEQTDFEAPGC